MKVWLLLLLAYPAAANFNGVGHSKALRGMFEMVQAQVKAGTGINDDVQGVVDELLEICQDIIDAIQEDHIYVQTQLDAGHAAVTTAATSEDEQRGVAMGSDAAVNTMQPPGCRQSNKLALLDWERCMKDLETCRDVEWERHDDYVGKMVWEWAVSPFATTAGIADKFLCEWTITGDNDPSSASLSDCPHWDTLESEVERLVEEEKLNRIEYDSAVAGWKVKYDECEEKREECTALWNKYSGERNVCYDDFEKGWGHKCVHGSLWQNLCTEWYHHDAYVQQVKSTDGGTGDAVSEVDRKKEYHAVKTIQCMLRHYEAEKGEFAAGVADCETYDDTWTYLEFDDTYASEVGVMTYYDDMPAICLESGVTYANYDWLIPSGAQEQEKCAAGDTCSTPYIGSKYYLGITPHEYAPLVLPNADNYLTFNMKPFDRCPEKAVTFVSLPMAPKFYDTDIVCAYVDGEAPPSYCEGYDITDCEHIDCMSAAPPAP